MNKRPKVFDLLAVIFFSIAMSFPIQALYLYGQGLESFGSALGKITILNYSVIALLVLNIPLLLRAHKSLLVTVPFTILIVGWNNFVVGSVGLDVSMATTVYASLGFLAVNSIMLTPNALKVLCNNRLRWWLVSPRKNLDVPVRISGFKKNLPIHTFDISKSGAFLTGFDDISEEDDFEHFLVEGEELELNINLDTLFTVKCTAKVVRVTEVDQGAYPKGVGVQFVNLPRREQRILERHLGH